MTPPYTSRLDEPACLDQQRFGGKAAGLARLAATGAPVAAGFAVATAAHRAFLVESGWDAPLDAALRDGDGQAIRQITEQLARAPVPEPVAAAIGQGYQRLCDQAGAAHLEVAVRSSATVEDGTAASFAGAYRTWLQVAGAEAVISRVRDCWCGSLTPSALDYAGSRQIDPARVGMAVVVQQTVPALAAGVMLTVSPVTGDRSVIAIEASWGLGLAVVGGEVTPDRWTVDKVSLTVTGYTAGDKRIEYRRAAAPVAVEADRRARPCLSEEQVIGLARLGKRIERAYGGAQDIEFAVDPQRLPGQELVLLQCRPETVWSRRAPRPRFAAGQPLTSWVTDAVTRHR